MSSSGTRNGAAAAAAGYNLAEYAGAATRGVRSERGARRGTRAERVTEETAEHSSDWKDRRRRAAAPAERAEAKQRSLFARAERVLRRRARCCAAAASPPPAWRRAPYRCCRAATPPPRISALDTLRPCRSLGHCNFLRALGVLTARPVAEARALARGDQGGALRRRAPRHISADGSRARRLLPNCDAVEPPRPREPEAAATGQRAGPRGAHDRHAAVDRSARASPTSCTAPQRPGWARATRRRCTRRARRRRGA